MSTFLSFLCVEKNIFFCFMFILIFYDGDCFCLFVFIGLIIFVRSQLSRPFCIHWWVEDWGQVTRHFSVYVAKPNGIWYSRRLWESYRNPGVWPVRSGGCGELRSFSAVSRIVSLRVRFSYQPSGLEWLSLSSQPLCGSSEPCFWYSD